MVRKIDGGSSVLTYPTGPDTDTATEPVKAGKKAEATISGNAAASQGSTGSSASAQSTLPAGRTGTASSATLQSGSSGAQVKKLQNDVNQWRVQAGSRQFLKPENLILKRKML